MVIPLSNGKRSRAVQLLSQAQRLLGITPEGAVNSNTNDSGAIAQLTQVVALLTQQNNYLMALVNKDNSVYLDG
ncbi:hypothetical protein, partial [Bacillus sp. mrc49]|uniref:hypothetical protein n=1 Tax=Bacillus sp. mrc49 TaxID=2054913 RepID=UPI000CA96631